MFVSKTKHSLLLLAQILVLFAFMAKAALPVGFMPAHGKSGALFPLVICSSEGAKTVFVGADKMPDMPVGDHKDIHGQMAAGDMPCAYAAVFSTGLMPLASLLVAAFSAPVTVEKNFSGILSSLFALSYLSRAPPGGFLI